MNLIPRFKDYDSLFENFFAPARMEETGFFSPRVDIKESDATFDVTAELPGVKKEDIHVDLHNGILSLSAEVKQEDKEEKDGKLIRQERRYGHFQRSFNVGSRVQASDITARFDNGILHISLPKSVGAEPEKQSVSIS